MCAADATPGQPCPAVRPARLVERSGAPHLLGHGKHVDSLAAPVERSHGTKHCLMCRHVKHLRAQAFQYRVLRPAFQETCSQNGFLNL